MIFRKSYIDLTKTPRHLQLKKNEAQKIIRAKVQEIKNYCRQSGFKRAVIGLSGGLDSAVAAVLAAEALGPKNLIAVRMPYLGISSKDGLLDAEKLGRALKIPQKNILTLPVNRSADASWQMLKKFKGDPSSLKLRRTLNFVAKSGIWTKLAKIRKGNLMARERMKILFDLSLAFKAVVMGTEDRTEAELGYYTLWGDQASGVEPLKNLWKTQIFQLASFMPEIPAEILAKVPSPDLWKEQTAEQELGINYLEVDIVLSAIKDLKMSRYAVRKKFSLSLDKINRILNRAKIGQIKRSIPYILKN